MKINRNIFVAVAVIASVALAACSSDESSPRGVQKGTELVYFSSSNSDNIVMSLADFNVDPTVTLSLSRDGDVSKALDVPVHFLANETGFSMPSTVSFAAGSKTASLKIDISKAQPKEYCNFRIKIDDAFCNPYSTTTDGIDVFVGSVLVSEWKTIVRGVKQYFNPGKVTAVKDTDIPYCTNNIEKLDGTNRFRITNMYNSGYNIPFTIANATNYDDNKMSTWNGDYVPLSNYNIDSWGYWWFDDNNGNDILVDYNGHTGCDVGCLPSTSYPGYNWITFTKDKTLGKYYITLCTYLYFNNTSWNVVYTHYIWTDSDFVNE